MEQLITDDMNETDVREVVVRPFLHRIGYRAGTDANIRSEVSLSYSRFQLGRKKGERDPKVRGRADYVCEVIGFGKTVVEVKGPTEPLDVDSVSQAFSYAAHPEIAALYILLCNGRSFKLFDRGNIEEPLLEWKCEETLHHLIEIANWIGPDAIKKQSRRGEGYRGKPLGVGLPSSAELVGGHVIYREHQSDSPLLKAEHIDGTRAYVAGGFARRLEDGRIHASLHLDAAMPGAVDLHKAAGLESYELFTSDEYISSDRESPTQFQNLVEVSVPQGTLFQPIVAGPKIPLPFSMNMVAFTEAVGFFDGQRFVGTMEIDYRLKFNVTESGSAIHNPMLARLPRSATLQGIGEFSIALGGATL